jgi:hypothetical protein
VNQPVIKYCKISHGLAHEIVTNFVAKSDEICKQISAICSEVGGVPKYHMSRGTLLEGFRIGLKGVPPGWRRDGHMPTYMVPDKKTKLGKEWVERLKAVSLLTGEDLANDLGLPPFFKDLTGHYCSAVGYMLYQGNVYVSLPAVLNLNHPNEPITYEEWQRVERERASYKAENN